MEIRLSHGVAARKDGRFYLESRMKKISTEKLEDYLQVYCEHTWENLRKRISPQRFSLEECKELLIEAKTLLKDVKLLEILIEKNGTEDY